MTKQKCAAAVAAKGWTFGSAGKYGTKGCYCYRDGKNAGRCYFGTGGTDEQMRTEKTTAFLQYPIFRFKDPKCW